MGIWDADHEETSPNAPILLINKLSCSLVGLEEALSIFPSTTLAAIYGGAQAVREQFQCNYGVNSTFQDQIAASGMVISAVGGGGEIRAVELPEGFYLATLYLPQMNSIPGKPHPLVAAFVQAAVN